MGTPYQHFQTPANERLQNEAVQAPRRAVLKGAAGIAAAFASGGALMPDAAQADAKLKPMAFRPLTPGDGSKLEVPEGYSAQVLFAWGEAVGSVEGMPEFKPDASNSAREQSLQAGMHHDGMFIFQSDKPNRLVLAINHEYTDENLLHTGGHKPITSEKVKKSLAAMGVSIIEVEQDAGSKAWRVVRPSRYARRITGETPMRFAGPAAGSDALKCASFPDGLKTAGTFGNCASGMTPWGTYLTCEENFHGYFSGVEKPNAMQRRYGASKNGFGLSYELHDPRFDAGLEPNSFNHFGWVVEIDPADPKSIPVKRTALGRFKHESASFSQTADGRVIIYSGDDERFEYLYKYVSKAKLERGGYAANARALDDGTLYVAKLDADGQGSWLPLVHGTGPLTAERGFASQAQVVTYARAAADALGATPMDRPEWFAVHPHTREAFVTLTNNSQRGAAGKPAADAANPRGPNNFGHIIALREGATDASFSWRHYAIAGDAKLANAQLHGRYEGDAFAAPDGLHFDKRGYLWVQTDMSGSVMHKGLFETFGANAMFMAHPERGELRRFLTAPRGAEVTGCVLTEDCKALFVNIQHPGEISDSGGDKLSNGWPYGDRPRSATVVITKDDGGEIGV